MKKRHAIAQVIAIRAQCDALLTALGVADEPDIREGAGCAHPADLREDLTTMGGPVRWRCRGCGFSTDPTNMNEA